MVINLLGLDIGGSRIGIARVNMSARLPEPLGTYKNDEFFLDSLKSLIKEHQIDTLVIGLPRNMQGQETAQSNYVRDFCKSTIEPLGLKILWQDETLSSVEAVKRLGARKYHKSDIDSQAAGIILEDYLKGSVNI